MTQILYNKAFSTSKPAIPEEYIEKAINEDKLQNLILVLPTGKLVRRYNQLIIRKYFEIRKKPLEYLRIFTLQQFIEFCYDMIFPERKRYQISDSYRLTIFEEALEKSDLKFYSRKNKKISSVLLERLANVIFGLKDDGITIQKLDEDLQKGADKETSFFDANRLSDIIELYKNYDALLGDAFLDFPKILNKVLSVLSFENTNDLIQNQIFPEIENIVIFGFSEFKHPEIEIIGKFANTDIKTSIYIDYTLNNGPIFGNLDDSIVHLSNQGFTILDNDSLLETRGKTEFLSNNFDSNISEFTRELYIRRWLFNTTSDMKSTGFSNMIKILACENKYYEAQNITKLIKYLILKENYKPSDICVCMRQPQMYSSLFRELFSSYKIPVNISDRFDLSSSPLVITIFSILNVINLGFKREDLHKMIGSRYVKFDKDIDTSNILEQAKKYRILGGNIRGGADYWKKTFSQRLISIKKRIVTIKNQNLSDTSELFRAYNDEKNLEKAVEDFNFISSLFTIKKTRLHPKDFFEFLLQQIIEKLNFKDIIIQEYHNYYNRREELDDIEKTTYEEAIEKDARALNKFIEIVNELCYILEDRFPNAEYSLDDLLLKLKTAVTTAKYQINEKEDFGVNITSIEQTRGIPYKVMVLCGAIDGVYPMQYRTDTFLGKELNSSMKRHLNSERLQFYQFLTNDKSNFNKSNKRIYITYPTHSDDEELVRSSFIDALLKITNLEESNNIFNISKIKNEKDNKRKQEMLNEIPWLNTTANNRELYEYIGNSVINPSNFNDTSSGSIEQIIPKNSQDKYINFILNKSNDNSKIEVEKLPTSIQEKILDYKDKPISITDLEGYAGCPYKFFITNILGLETKEDFDLSMSPLIKGNILHSILYNFYVQIKNEQLDSGNYEYKISSNNPEVPPIIPVILNPNEKQNYIIKLIELANHELEYVRFEHPFYQLDEERILGSADRISILENWLNFEFQRIENNWGFSPVLFEFGFGIGRFSKFDFVEIDGLKIKGKIDRIELMTDGNQYKFLIADYKNRINKKHEDRFIKDGLAFQMPLYMLAAKELLLKGYNLDVDCECGVYYSFENTKKGTDIPYHKFNLVEYDSHFANLYNFTKRSKKTLFEGETTAEIMHSSLEKAKEIVTNISNGIFPVEPKNNECQYCKLLSICRFKQRNIFEYINEDED